MYRGREGQWAFLLHRLSGLAILFYLLAHTISIGSVMLGKDTYDTIHKVYYAIPFRLGLVLVAAGVAYHAVNGLRIIAMDFTDWGVKYQRQMWYASMVFAVIVGIIVLYANLPRIFPGVFTWTTPWGG
jgi:succinate dehydrogenase / fumarate reductase cytochrome b subunit